MGRSELPSKHPKYNQKEEKLLSKILWFDNRVKYDIDFFEILTPQRIVNEHPRYKSGVFYSEKCQREIQYESGLELEFIKQLEQTDKVKFFWEQPVQIPYKRGKKKDIYTPDFAVYLDTKEVFLVEIKDVPGMLDNRVQMKIEALLEFCSTRGFGLMLTDGKNNLEKIKKVKYNKELEKAILNAVSDNRVLRRKECKEILKKYNSTQSELQKIILKNNLKCRSTFSKIERENKNKIFRHVFIEGKRYEDLKAVLPSLVKRG